MNSTRNYAWIDHCCLAFDQVLKTLTHQSPTTGRPYPPQAISDDKAAIEEVSLTEAERKHAAALMRINHAGEICAQALYHGQAFAARNPSLRIHLQTAAIEEGDHLKWCQLRLDELQSHASYLNPLWYAGSFAIGCFAATIGDTWSLGFVAETEKQVIAHLQKHLQLLSPHDKRSAVILQQMEKDEGKHREEAIENGAKDLPQPIQTLMAWVSKVMVKTSYWL